MVSEEALREIVSKRVDKITSDATKEMTRIREGAEQELNRVVPDLTKQIEGFPKFKLLDILEILGNGGIVKTVERKVDGGCLRQLEVLTHNLGRGIQ